MRFLLSLVIFASAASAETGLSAFAIMHERYPCDKFLEAFHGVDVKAIAILDGWFGSDRTCLDKFLKLSGRKIVEIHIRHVPKNKPETLDETTLSRRARKWEEYRRKHTDTTWLLSDGLESHSSIPASRKRIAYIRKYFYGQIVHNPLIERDPYSVGADIIELHDARYVEQWKRKTIFNYDGYGINYLGTRGRNLPFYASIPEVRSDVRQAKRDGNLIFLWDAHGQGTERSGVNSDPRKRAFTIIGNAVKNSLLRE